MRIGIIGDLHLKEKLGYSDYIQDCRKEEKQDILDNIVKSLHDCEAIVMLGDQLNSRNNSSETIKEFVAFIERFGNKQVYVIAGNHEKFGDGRSAIDFLKEINKENWHIVTNTIEMLDIGNRKVTFLPYFSRSEIDAKDDKEGEKKLLKILEEKKSDILFAHHSITDFYTSSGAKTNEFNEIVFSQKKLEKLFDTIIAGHVHLPQKKGKTIISGSVFNNEVGEEGKSIWILDTKDLSITEKNIPGRKIYKRENPTIEELEKISGRNIIKVILTKKIDDNKLDELKSFLKERFDTYVLLEQYDVKRKKVHFDEGALDFSIESLLKIYAKEKKVDLKSLENGFNIIKE